MNAQPQFRIIFSASKNGKHFRVDRYVYGYGRARWEHFERFSSVPHALAKYPDAEVSEMATTQQRFAEGRPHAYSDHFDGSGLCFHCGRATDFAAHQKGGAR